MMRCNSNWWSKQNCYSTFVFSVSASPMAQAAGSCCSAQQRHDTGWVSWHTKQGIWGEVFWRAFGIFKGFKALICCFWCLYTRLCEFYGIWVKQWRKSNKTCLSYFIFILQTLLLSQSHSEKYHRNFVYIPKFYIYNFSFFLFTLKIYLNLLFSTFHFLFTFSEIF